MSTLQRAIEIAVEAHNGQTDKAGAPYILHPLRVMLALATEEMMIAGVLHDVDEDCPGWTLARLREEHFSQPIIDAIEAVTKRAEEREDYFAFIARASRDAIGREVKLADLRDNANIARIAEPTDLDRARQERYRQAIEQLSGPGA